MVCAVSSGKLEKLPSLPLETLADTESSLVDSCSRRRWLAEAKLEDFGHLLSLDGLAGASAGGDW